MVMMMMMMMAKVLTMTYIITMFTIIDDQDDELTKSFHRCNNAYTFWGNFSCFPTLMEAFRETYEELKKE